MSHAVSHADALRWRPRWNEWHPWLTGLAIVAAVVERNLQFLEWSSLFYLATGAVVLATFSYLVAWWLRRSTAHAAMLATGSLLAFALYGAAFKTLARWGGAPEHPGWHLPLLAGLAAVAFSAWRLHRAVAQVGAWCSLTMLLVLVPAGVRILWAGWHSGRPAPPVAVELTRATVRQQATVDSPDIYYLILDGYARADVLRRQYGFDNSPFLDQLRARGFYVADQSCANYPVTVLSVSSSLSLQYHTRVAEPFQHSVYFAMVRSPAIATYLQRLGYEYVHYRNTWPGASSSPIADHLLGEERGVWDLVHKFQEPSAWRFWPRNQVRLEHAQVIQQGFMELPRVAHNPRPTFTFAHFVAPHPPYVFDREGRVRDDIDPWSPQSYVDELVAINREILRVVDEILRNSRVRPVIVLQSDHGPGFAADERGDEQEWVQERFPILNCYLVPESMREKLYSTITPVNTFRLVLSECFGAELPLLPDRHFVAHYRNLARVAEVTPFVRQGVPQTAIRLPDPNGPLRR